MYAAALVRLLCIPLALPFLWGVLVILAVFPPLARGLIDEEQILLRDLKDYAEYREKVFWRLIPYIYMVDRAEGVRVRANIPFCA